MVFIIGQGAGICTALAAFTVREINFISPKVGLDDLLGLEPR